MKIFSAIQKLMVEIHVRAHRQADTHAESKAISYTFVYFWNKEGDWNVVTLLEYRHALILRRILWNFARAIELDVAICNILLKLKAILNWYENKVKFSINSSKGTR
jgi:hypothetical protein